MALQGRVTPHSAEHIWWDNSTANQLNVLTMNNDAQTNVEDTCQIEIMSNCLKYGSLNILPDKPV